MGSAAAGAVRQGGQVKAGTLTSFLALAGTASFRFHRFAWKVTCAHHAYVRPQDANAATLLLRLRVGWMNLSGPEQLVVIHFTSMLPEQRSDGILRTSN